MINLKNFIDRASIEGVAETEIEKVPHGDGQMGVGDLLNSMNIIPVHLKREPGMWLRKACFYPYPGIKSSTNFMYLLVKPGSNDFTSMITPAIKGTALVNSNNQIGDVFDSGRILTNPISYVLTF